MIWATVSSWTCFCWLYRASPSLAAKNIINLIFTDHLVVSMCRVFSYVFRKGYLLWPVCSLGKTLSLWPAWFCILRPNLPVTHVSLDFLLLHSNSLWWKGHLLRVLFLEGLVGVHRTIQLQPLLHNWLGHRLGLLWYWMASPGNQQSSFGHFCVSTKEQYLGLFCWFGEHSCVRNQRAG